MNAILMEVIVVKQLHWILGATKRDAIVIYLVFQPHLFLVIHNIFTMIHLVNDLKLFIQCLDHQCRYFVGIENLLLFQNNVCDELVNKRWCGYDFGDCDAPKPISQGINIKYQFNLMH